MTPSQLEKRLSDLIAFQCVLVALRGVCADASEEMLWHAFLSSLTEQYGYRRAWYGRSTGGVIRPAVIFPLHGVDQEEVPTQIHESSDILHGANLVLPVSIEATLEGF